MKRKLLLIGWVLIFGSGTASARGHGGFGGHFGGGGFGGHGGFHGAGHFGGGYHRGGGLGIYLGYPGYFPGYWPGYYYGPRTYYYPDYSPSIIVPATPPVYIEQGNSPQPSTSSGWNYCTNPQGYYPYVQECPSGWQSVPQQPYGQEPNHWYYCVNPQGYYPYVRECPAGWQKVPPQPMPEN